MTLRKRYFRPVEDEREDIRFWQIERWKRTLNDRHDGFGQRKASDKVRVKQSTKFFLSMICSRPSCQDQNVTSANAVRH
jgi:hypothetical protein